MIHRSPTRLPADFQGRFLEAQTVILRSAPPTRSSGLRVARLVLLVNGEDSVTLTELATICSALSIDVTGLRVRLVEDGGR